MHILVYVLNPQHQVRRTHVTLIAPILNPLAMLEKNAHAAMRVAREFVSYLWKTLQTHQDIKKLTRNSLAASTNVHELIPSAMLITARMHIARCSVQVTATILTFTLRVSMKVAMRLVLLDFLPVT